MKQNRKSRNRFIYTYNLHMMKLEFQIRGRGIFQERALKIKDEPQEQKQKVIFCPGLTGCDWNVWVASNRENSHQWRLGEAFNGDRKTLTQTKLTSVGTFCRETYFPGFVSQLFSVCGLWPCASQVTLGFSLRRAGEEVCWYLLPCICYMPGIILNALFT